MKGKIYITNGISPSMFPLGEFRLRTEEIKEENKIEKLRRELKEAEGRIVSAIGHEILKTFYEEVLKVKLETKRIRITLEEGDTLITIKFIRRLPENFIKFLRLQSEKEIINTLKYYFRRGELSVFKITIIKKYKRKTNK